MTGETDRPTEEKVSRRERLHARHRAEDTWRRHEIAGRLDAIKKGLEKERDRLSRLLDKLEEVLPKEPAEDKSEEPGEAEA